ncbi:MAG: hypothetical protein IKO52_06460 [Clostridia bacterium]|nr:hypothetical protein [Clostridia bacterium]
MGVIRVTPRPSYHAALEAEKAMRALEPEPEFILTGKVSVRMGVGGVRDVLMRYKQKRIEGVIHSALRKKGSYNCQYNSPDDRGYYSWDNLTLHGNMIYVDAMQVGELTCLEKVMDALNEKGWYPEEIILTYFPDGGDISTVYNLYNILESRRLLIEQALSLKEPMQIILNNGLALGITLSVFSYPVIEAAAFLIAQACKMALATGKARMKSCDMSNPKFQMRTWLLRLGFIGKEFERPRRTLLEGLEGDTAFFSEEQKQVAVAKRKAQKLNAPLPT